MVATVENITGTDPNEQPLDGTVGGKLDPESTENTDGGGVKVTPQANDVINRAITKGVEDIKKLKEERAAVNSKIAAIIEDLDAKGVNRHAFRYNMRVLDMAEDQRGGLDLSYLLCRQATGQPFQQDWIDESEFVAGE